MQDLYRICIVPVVSVATPDTPVARLATEYQ